MAKKSLSNLMAMAGPMVGANPNMLRPPSKEHEEAMVRARKQLDIDHEIKMGRGSGAMPGRSNANDDED